MKYSTDLIDISINVNSHLKNTFGQPMELEDFVAMVAEYEPEVDNDSLLAALEEEDMPSGVVGVLEELGVELDSSNDNSYNWQSDFDYDIDFAIVKFGGESLNDWYYKTDACFAIVSVHRGGDPRGNYNSWEVYDLSNAPDPEEFLVYKIGFSLFDAKTMERLEVDKFSAGWTSDPMSAMGNENSGLTTDRWDVLGRWRQEGFQCRYKGNTVYAVPEVWHCELNWPVAKPAVDAVQV